MKGSCCSFVSLLRDMFGEVATVSSVQTGDAGEQLATESSLNIYRYYICALAIRPDFVLSLPQRSLDGDWLLIMLLLRVPTTGTLAGHVRFERGPCVSLLVDLNSPVSRFELMAWGVKGHAKVSKHAGSTEYRHVERNNF